MAARSTFSDNGRFQRREDHWLLHEVKTSTDNTLLMKPNEIAGLTDVELHNAERGVIML
jgi:hypothetical protein